MLAQLHATVVAAIKDHTPIRKRHLTVLP